ncbi:unnamed protein product, partial [Sphacelaria rigidula]
TVVRTEVWHKRLGHPSEEVLRGIKNDTESGVNFEGTLSLCDTWMTNKSTQQNHPKTNDSDNITDRLQRVRTDISGPVTLTAINSGS